MAVRVNTLGRGRVSDFPHFGVMAGQSSHLVECLINAAFVGRREGVSVLVLELVGAPIQARAYLHLTLLSNGHLQGTHII